MRPSIRKLIKIKVSFDEKLKAFIKDEKKNIKDGKEETRKN